MGLGSYRPPLISALLRLRGRNRRREQLPNLAREARDDGDQSELRQPVRRTPHAATPRFRRWDSIRGRRLASTRSPERWATAASGWCAGSTATWGRCVTGPRSWSTAPNSSLLSYETG